MSKCSASWAIVRSPLTAARATFALKAGEWFRRGRLLMVSPVHGDYRRCQAEIPLIVLFRFPGPALKGGKVGDRYRYCPLRPLYGKGVGSGETGGTNVKSHWGARVSCVPPEGDKTYP